MIAFPSRLLFTLVPAVLMADTRALASPDLLLNEVGGFVSGAHKGQWAWDSRGVFLVSPR